MSFPRNPRIESSIPSLDDGRAESENKAFTLLSDLELSLRASQRALLGRDLAMLERLSAEQSSITHNLSQLWRKQTRAAADETMHIPLSPTLREIGQRVLHLGRVHQALLARCQRSLRVAANLAAGMCATYSPFSASPRQNFMPTKEV